MAKYSKRKARAAVKRISKAPAWVIVTALVLAVLLGVGYFLYIKFFKKEEFIPPVGELEFHFMMLGNEYAGDCIYVRAGDNDILIDAGSKEDSIEHISKYVNNYMTDNTFEYVIVTHADQDHIVGFAKENGSIFDLYNCEVIIDFPISEKSTKVYQRYQSERAAEVEQGAKHFTALECFRESKEGAQRIYNLTDDGNIKMEILYNYFYENDADHENDYSVCVQFHHGSRKFLFTGDLEEEGEEYLVQHNELSQVELFKAGHHGSATSSNAVLLNVIKPKLCVVSCCAGSAEYYKGNLHTLFPSQKFIDEISKYTEKVYIPITIDIIQTKGQNTPNDKSDDDYDNDGEYKLLNGNITVISKADIPVYAKGSNNDTVLKDTDWYKANRTSTYWDN